MQNFFTRNEDYNHCVDAQADSSLCLTHMSDGTSSHVVAQLLSELIRFRQK